MPPDPATGLQNLQQAEEVLAVLEFLLSVALAQHARGLVSVPVCLTEGVACLRPQAHCSFVRGRSCNAVDDRFAVGRNDSRGSHLRMSGSVSSHRASNKLIDAVLVERCSVHSTWYIHDAVSFLAQLAPRSSVGT